MEKKMPHNMEEVEEDERMKYEIAEELGLLDKVFHEGWRALTSKETGRIGGMITRKKRELKNTDKNIYL